MMTLEFGRTAEPAAATPVVSSFVMSAKSAKVTALKTEAVPAKHHFGFRELLSDLNPLQYIPVIGTIFRAITGDVIPEPVRETGSLVVSTLIAGPIGAAMNLGEFAAEKLTGVDPEKIGDRMLADIGIGHKPSVAAPKAEEMAKTTERVGQAPSAWSHAQLAAYGVTTSASGELAQGDLFGSDVLNNLELNELRAQHATVKYNVASQMDAGSRPA